ncbi:ATP-binding protein [Candidatus Magnetobacterium casense]|nr:ATP-binding protein [Candidatus Magnetobacterium casensis]
MLKNVKIGTRLSVGFFMVFLLLTSTVLFGISRVDHLYSLINKMYGHLFTVTRAILDIKDNINKIDDFMDLIVNGKYLSNIDKYSLNIDALEKKVYEDFDIISKCFLGDKALHDSELRLYSKWKPVRDEIIAFVKAGKTDEAKEIFDGRYTLDKKGVKKATNAIVDSSKENADVLFNHAGTTTKDVLDSMRIFLLLAVIISVLIAYLITRSITVPLSTLNTAAIEIGKQRSDIQINVTGDDEIGLLASSFRSMAENVKEFKKKLEEINVVLNQRVLEETAKRQQHEQILIQQSKMAAMGEMISLIAHQWKQPLNAISVITTDIGDAYSFNELTQDYLKSSETKIIQQVQFMSRTIDDFRNFLKPSKEKITFDLKKAIDEIASILSPMLIKSNITLNLHSVGNETNINVTGYPNEFKHVILNLVNNARDAIVSRNINDPETKKEINIDISGEGAKTIVSIRDSGGGIPDDIIGRIFEPYFTTKPSEQGTGIGLYMSKTIIETNMNWKLTVRNTDNGAEFRIEI